MDVSSMLSALLAEREQIEEAIRCLERLDRANTGIRKAVARPVTRITLITEPDDGSHCRFGSGTVQMLRRSHVGVPTT